MQMHLKESKITELFALITGIARSDIYAPHICDIFVTFFRHLFGEKPIALNSKHEIINKIHFPAFSALHAF